MCNAFLDDLSDCRKNTVVVDGLNILGMNCRSSVLTVQGREEQSDLMTYTEAADTDIWDFVGVYPDRLALPHCISKHRVLPIYMLRTPR